MKPPKEPHFKINDTVYHITPESPQGIVIDVEYSYLTGLHQYYVTFGPHEASLKYYEHELQSHRNYAK